MSTADRTADISEAERHQLEAELGIELIPGTEVMTEYVCVTLRTRTPANQRCRPVSQAMGFQQFLVGVVEYWFLNPRTTLTIR